MPSLARRLVPAAATLTLLALHAPQALAETPPQSPVPCLEKSALNTQMTPPQLYQSLASCAVADAWEPAIFLFALAGAYGRFDAARVTDTSAHQAVQVLPMMLFGGLPPEKSEALKAQLQSTLGNDATRGRYCSEVIAMGAPTYHPAYMINHGMGAMMQPGKDVLAPSFNAAQTWPEVVKTYLQCPAAS